MPQEILIIDDEPEIRVLLARYLEESGFQVTTVENGMAAKEFLATSQPVMIILDLKLPDIDGLELAREIRASSSLPIIMLTGVGTETDRVVGLELAADDYMTKPFSPRELLARIKAVLRRTGQTWQANPEGRLKNSVKFADWTLNLTLRELVSPVGETIKLTNNEFKLLVTFITHPQRVLSRDKLLELSRTDPAEVFDRTIDYLVLQLRRKLEIDPSHPKIIKTEWGAGYIFNAEVIRCDNSDSPE